MPIYNVETLGGLLWKRLLKNGGIVLHSDNALA